MADAGFWIDWDNEGLNVVDVGTDETQYLISASYRRGGSAEVTGAATPGSAVFLLKNTDGRFTPTNAGGPLYGLLTDGVPVWFGLASDGTVAPAATVYGRFAGRITDISPLPVSGAGADTPTVEIVCEDPLGWYGRTPVQLTVDCDPAGDE